MQENDEGLCWNFRELGEEDDEEVDAVQNYEIFFRPLERCA
jgi:hypothetical protein